MATTKSTVRFGNQLPTALSHDAPLLLLVGIVEGSPKMRPPLPLTGWSMGAHSLTSGRMVTLSACAYPMVGSKHSDLMSSRQLGLECAARAATSWRIIFA